MLVDMVRCHEADPEGYRCVLVPQHEGPHKWGRCLATDAEGYRCILPPSHPGGHELAWFARPTDIGDTHTMPYAGRYERASDQARKDMDRLATHQWFPVSRDYVPSALGARLRPLAFLFAGKLVVVYEYRPRT